MAEYKEVIGMKIAESTGTGQKISNRVVVSVSLLLILSRIVVRQDDYRFTWISKIRRNRVMILCW